MKWSDRINKKYMQISVYVIITVIVIYSLSLLLKNAPAVAKVVMDKLNWVIGVTKPVILGFVFAYIMEPLVSFFERRYQKLKNIKFLKKVVAPRGWGAFTSVFFLLIAFALLISLLVFTVTDQLRLANFDDLTTLAQRYLDNFEAFYQSISDKLNQLDIKSTQFEQYLTSATNYLTNGLKNFATGTFNSIKNMSGYLTTFIFSFIIGIYFMIDGKMFMNYIKKVCKALFSDNANKKMIRMVHDLDDVFSGYIRGQLTDALVMMFLISVALSITGVKFAVVIGVFAGIGNLIPYFGPIVAYISTSLVCLMNGDIKVWVISMIALFIIQAVDGNLIGPKLLSNSIQIHPLIVMVSLIFGSAIGGLLGMLLAVPVGAYLKLVFVRFVNHQLERKMELNK